MFVDLYAIQNVPPSNINRDDTGSPKTAFYGGSLRARVSSQAWKKAMRKIFTDMLPENELGVRTKVAVSLVQHDIESLRPDLSERAEDLAKAVLGATGVKIGDSRRAGSQEGAPVTQYLIFIGKNELSGLAKVGIRWADEGEDISKVSASMKKEVAAAFHGVKALDIALFGRMLADAPTLNEDASSQVAHAISVDKIIQEYDYFTAVDDCADEDNAGAAMIDTVGFNSSTLYRYATIDLDALEKQLGNSIATAKGAETFVDAFIRSMPTGKQNTFANRTLPNIVVVAIRKQQPINAVDAFQDAIQPEPGKSISQKAGEFLGSKLAEIETAYDAKPVVSWNIIAGSSIKQLDDVSQAATLDEMKEQLNSTIQTLLEEEKSQE